MIMLVIKRFIKTTKLRPMRKAKQPLTTTEKANPLIALKQKLLHTTQQQRNNHQFGT